MKRYIYSTVAILLVAVTVTPLSQAADNTVINITANIVASPCTISTSNLNIDLGDIQASTLEIAGSTTPWSAVNTIYLTNCPAATKSVIARFSGTVATNGDSDGYKNDGADPMISVQLADNASTPKILSNGKTETEFVADGAAKVDLKARLYASGAVSPGAVRSTINVSFEFK